MARGRHRQKAPAPGWDYFAVVLSTQRLLGRNRRASDHRVGTGIGIATQTEPPLAGWAAVSGGMRKGHPGCPQAVAVPLTCPQVRTSARELLPNYAAWSSPPSVFLASISVSNPLSNSCQKLSAEAKCYPSRHAYIFPHSDAQARRDGASNCYSSLQTRYRID